MVGHLSVQSLCIPVRHCARAAQVITVVGSGAPVQAVKKLNGTPPVFRALDIQVSDSRVHQPLSRSRFRVLTHVHMSLSRSRSCLVWHANNLSTQQHLPPSLERPPLRGATQREFHREHSTSACVARKDVQNLVMLSLVLSTVHTPDTGHGGEQFYVPNAIRSQVMTKDTGDLTQFHAVACREYTLPREDEASQPKGWIQRNTKIGPVLEVATSYLHGKYGVEIRIWSLNKDNTHSWVRICDEFQQQ